MKEANPSYRYVEWEANFRLVPDSHQESSPRNILEEYDIPMVVRLSVVQ